MKKTSIKTNNLDNVSKQELICTDIFGVNRYPAFRSLAVQYEGGVKMYLCCTKTALNTIPSYVSQVCQKVTVGITQNYFCFVNGCDNRINWIIRNTFPIISHRILHVIRAVPFQRDRYFNIICQLRVKHTFIFQTPPLHGWNIAVMVLNSKQSINWPSKLNLLL